MKRTFFNELPEEFVTHQHYAEIRLDIKEEPKQEEESTAQYSAVVVYCYAPLSQNHFIENAMNEMYGTNYESKLQNEYNAALMQLYDPATCKAMIERYTTFLADRKSMKAEIESICLKHNIK